MMDEHQKEARDLIERMMAASGLDLTGLARRADLSPSTLTRFMNGKDVKHTVSAKTLQKLSEASGVPVTMGGDPGDPRLAKLVANYKKMAETAKHALVGISDELASPAAGQKRNSQPSNLPKPISSQARIRRIGSGR